MRNDARGPRGTKPCLYCGFPTTHPFECCPAHRDLAPPIEGLDVPYNEGDQIALELPGVVTVDSRTDGYRS